MLTEANPAESNARLQEESSGRLMRSSYSLIWLAIAISAFVNGLLGEYQPSSDVVSYLDLSDFFITHKWHAIINAYWFPGYPFLVALARLSTGHGLRYELLATRVLGGACSLLFVVAAALLASSLRTLLIMRGVRGLVSQRVISILAGIVAVVFSVKFLNSVTPDGILSSFMLLTLAFMTRGIAKGSLLSWAAAGLFGGLAFLTKSFALPFFVLCVLSAVAIQGFAIRALRSVVIFGAFFLLIAVPWIWKMSEVAGHITFGGTGALAEAWCINGADRFNPVSDPTMFRPGSAVVDLRHPGELLARNPEIVYFDGRVPGTTPLWDNPSFWEEGLRPKFNLRQTVSCVFRQMVALARVIGGVLPVLVLLATPLAFGFRPRQPFGPILAVFAAIAIASIGIYALVLIEGRYVSFALVMLGIVWLLSCRRSWEHPLSTESLQITVFLLAFVVVAAQFNLVMSNKRRFQEGGARPLAGIYSLAINTAGSKLALQFPPGTEVACMGDEACWGDPYWARYARLRMSAVIETGEGRMVGKDDSKDGMVGCSKLEENPDVLEVLRTHHIRAIVGNFAAGSPCSTRWQSLFGDLYYLPL